MTRRQGLILAAQCALLAAAVATAAVTSTSADWYPLELVGLLFVLAVGSDMLTVEVRGVWISGSFVALVLAMALLGPAPAAAIGAGSALIAPAALTLLFQVFGGSNDLPKALAFYGAAAPAGGTAGVFLGGVLTEYASWPWVFFINIPVAAAVLLLTRSVMPAGMTGRGSLDLAGATTATLGLGAVVFAIVRAPEVGWTSGSTLLAASAASRSWVCSSRCRPGSVSR